MIQLRISLSKKSNNQYGLIHFIKNTITKNNLQKNKTLKILRQTQYLWKVTMYK